MADSVTALPSIQGEQQQVTGWVQASDADVDNYVDRVSDDVLACRERGRHLFPTIREAGMVFTEVDDDGLFLRRLRNGKGPSVDVASAFNWWPLAWNTAQARMARPTSPPPAKDI